MLLEKKVNIFTRYIFTKQVLSFITWFAEDRMNPQNESESNQDD